MIRTIWSFTYLCPSCGDEMVCYAAYLDLVGNARLAFDTVYIERTVADKPRSETRALRSIFTPKAAAILRVLLRDPDRAWRVADLATGLKPRMHLRQPRNHRELGEPELRDATPVCAV